MGIKAWTSRVLLVKGKSLFLQFVTLNANTSPRFGWVNSSYILGYKHLDVHMRRAVDLQISYEEFSRTPNSVLEEGSDEDAVSEEAEA